MSERLPAIGTQLLVTGVMVPGVSNVDGPGGSTPTLDATAHDDTQQQFVLGLSDPGEVSVDLFYDPADAQHKALIAAWVARTKLGFAIKWPKADFPTSGSFQGSCNFSGFVMEFRRSAPVGDLLTAAVTLRTSGAIQNFPT